ncbi:LysR family transcriptional regulator [Hespellia stercorisuis]|uniref:DNA-binding transcriptional regulator, LysR family n=1 Tax=Hespellia stercorisuis DSM 15480 TaxID=1121950 RepID=A0A1M6UXY1_9FIRM|nr:LysR family transcriptional regulator [Hespellia stercorisuis]SHK73981.1 DNA-binding transcriptional regulator, LysR family [Hespellia stercorisuis DSM 15480]
MNLNQLYYFQSIARLQHFTQAAEELHISQPSLSYAMSSLENELGTRLFEKKGRNVVLTKYGKIFLEHVTLSLSELETGIHKLQKYTSSEQGQIDIGYVYPLAPRYIPKMVRSFLDIPRNQDVNFTFYQGITSTLIDGLKAEKYDVIFASQVSDEPAIEFVPLLRHSLSVIVPRDHPLAERTSVSIQEIQPYPLVVYNEETGLGQLTLKLFEISDMTPNIISRAENEQALYGLVSEGFGISIAAVIPEISLYEIKAIPVDEPYCNRHIHMAYLKDHFQPPALERFIQYGKTHTFEM